MRKNIFVILLLILISLTSCDPDMYSLNLNELMGEITKIELVEYENDNPIYKKVNESFNPIFNYDETILIERLNEDYFNSFVGELSKLCYYKYRNKCLLSPIGITLVIFSEDYRIVISFDSLERDKIGFFCKFDKSFNFIEYIGDVDAPSMYEEILEKYFTSA